MFGSAFVPVPAHVQQTGVAVGVGVGDVVGVGVGGHPVVVGVGFGPDLQHSFHCENAAIFSHDMPKVISSQVTHFVFFPVV